MISNKKQAISGILLLNKPLGLTSNAILQKVKRLYQAAKAGHTGSLDPLATGMLPICFGEATKLCQYLLDADKTYRATGLLGVKTDTADAEGTVIKTVEHFNIDRDALLEVFQTFTGVIQQTPSMFSALKHQGVPLYRLARQGINLERESRATVIHDLRLLDYDGQSFTIDVSCSKGTYIRNLVEDIGETLGVCAHVTALHRTSTAGFTEDQMIDFEALEQMTASQRMERLLPPERAVEYLPRLDLSTDEALKLKRGQTVTAERNLSVQGLVRLHDVQEGFIGLGDVNTEGLLKVKRLMALSQETVSTP